MDRGESCQYESKDSSMAFFGTDKKIKTRSLMLLTLSALVLNLRIHCSRLGSAAELTQDLSQTSNQTITEYVWQRGSHRHSCRLPRPSFHVCGCCWNY